MNTREYLMNEVVKQLSITDKINNYKYSRDASRPRSIDDFLLKTQLNIEFDNICPKLLGIIASGNSAIKLNYFDLIDKLANSRISIDKINLNHYWFKIMTRKYNRLLIGVNTTRGLLLYDSKVSDTLDNLGELTDNSYQAAVINIANHNVLCWNKLGVKNFLKPTTIYNNDIVFNGYSNVLYNGMDATIFESNLDNDPIYLYYVGNGDLYSSEGILNHNKFYLKSNFSSRIINIFK